MQVKTSINLNLHLRDEVKLIYGEYGAKSLSAFVNGFFYYLSHSENPPNGVDIKRCLQDALDGKIVKTQNYQLLEDARKEKLAHSHLDSYWGRDVLMNIRRFGMKRVISRGILRQCSKEIFDIHAEVILEDDMLRYLTDWYEEARKHPDFQKVEYAVLLAGGVPIPNHEHENTEDTEIES